MSGITPDNFVISFLAYQVKRLPCGTVSTAQQGPVLITFVLSKVLSELVTIRSIELTSHIFSARF